MINVNVKYFVLQEKKVWAALSIPNNTRQLRAVYRLANHAYVYDWTLAYFHLLHETAHYKVCRLS